MTSFLLRFSLSTKTSLMALLGYLFFGGALLFVTSTTMHSYLMEGAQKHVNVKAGLTRALLEKSYGKDYRIEDGRLFIGQTPINDKNDAIDDLARLMGGGVVTVFMGDTRVATNVVNPQTGARAVGTKLAKNAAYDSVFGQKKIYFGEVPILGEEYLTAYDPIVSASGEVIGIIFVGIKKSEQLNLIDTMLKHIATMTLLLGLFMSAVTYIAIKAQLSPLATLQAVMARLQKEDTSVEVPAQERGDEIGHMAKAIACLRESVAEKIRLREDQAAIKMRAEEERRQTMHALASDFEASVKSVVSAISEAAHEIKANAKSLSSVAEDTNQKSATVAGAAEQAAYSIQTVVSAAEQLNLSIADINRQIEESNHVAGACVTEAEATGTVMQTLSEAAENIDSVVKLIEDIAHQVNLLALNATIEAARAGEAGKGFAVVAGEVKNLANQASNATKNITDQIANIQEQTKQAVETIGAITETIRHVSSISASIAQAVSKQGDATRDISGSIARTAHEAQTVSDTIGSVTQSARQAGQASVNVLQTAEKLESTANALGQEVDRLIAHIRKA